MANIKLLFTCPHCGKNDDGTTTNPPIIKRDKTHFPDNICPTADGQGFSDENDFIELPRTDKDFIELLVGTDQTNSRKALTDADFWGPNGLIPLLGTKKIRAYPENLNQEMENFPLDGGYTIREYGSKRIKSGLVAIQIEVINCIRDNRYCREKFAED